MDREVWEELLAKGYKFIFRGYVKNGWEGEFYRTEDVGPMVFVGTDKVFSLIMKKNMQTKFVITDLKGNILKEEDVPHMFMAFYQADYDPFNKRIGIVMDHKIFIMDEDLNIIKEVEVPEAEGSRLVGFSFSSADPNIVYVTFPKQNNGLSPYIVEGKGKLYFVDIEKEEVVKSRDADAFFVDTLMEWGTRNELLVLAMYRHGYALVVDREFRERSRVYFPYPHSVRTSLEGLLAVGNGAFMVESNLFMVLGDAYNDYNRGNDPPFWGVGDPFFYGSFMANASDFHPEDPRVVTWTRWLSGGIAYLPKIKTMMGEIIFVQLSNGLEVEKNRAYKVKIDWARGYTYLPIYGTGRVYFSLDGTVRVYRIITGYSPFGAKAGNPVMYFERKLKRGEHLELGTGIYYFEFIPHEEGKLYSWAEIPVPR